MKMLLSVVFVLFSFLAYSSGGGTGTGELDETICPKINSVRAKNKDKTGCIVLDDNQNPIFIDQEACKSRNKDDIIERLIGK